MQKKNIRNELPKKNPCSFRKKMTKKFPNKLSNTMLNKIVKGFLKELFQVIPMKTPNNFQ